MAEDPKSLKLRLRLQARSASASQVWLRCADPARQKLRVAQPPDTSDKAPLVEADDAVRAALLKHHVDLECAILAGPVGPARMAEYIRLRDASWALQDSRFNFDELGYDSDGDWVTPPDVASTD